MGTAAAVIALLVVRKLDTFLNPQFWAEDFLFLLDAEKFGASTFFAPRGGYLHLFPRMVASIATRLDPFLQPGFYLLCSSAVIVGVVFLCLSPRHALPNKRWLALCILILPHSGEVFLNVTNVQWIAALGLIVTALKTDPDTPWTWTSDLGFLWFAGLSGPFVIFAFPAFVLRSWQRRTPASYLLLLACAVPAFIQTWFVLHAPPDNEFSGAFGLSGLVATLLYRIPGHLFLGRLGGDHPGEMIPAILALTVFVVVLIFVVAYRCRSQRRNLLVFFSFALLLVGAATIRKRFDLWSEVDVNSGDRYFYIPNAILLWATGVLCTHARTKVERWACVGLVFSSFALNAPRFFCLPSEDFHWYARCPAIRRGELVELTINPGWKFQYRRGSFESGGPL